MKYLLPEKWKYILLISNVDCDKQFLIYILIIRERDIKVWKVHKFICNTDLLQIGIKQKILVILVYFPEVAYLKSELWGSPYSFYHMNCYLFHHSSFSCVCGEQEFSGEHVVHSLPSYNHFWNSRLWNLQVRCISCYLRTVILLHYQLIWWQFQCNQKYK